MGCKGSKEGKEDKAIQSDFEHIGFPSADQYFRTARDLLENAEKIRGGIEENKEKGAELSGVFKLKDPKYNDVVQVLFWTLSAQAEGQIKNTGVDIDNEIPYIKLEGGKVSHDTFTLYETFTAYVRTIAEGPSTVKDIVEKLEDLSKQTPDITKNTKDEIQASSLSFGDKAKAIANLGKNTSKLGREVPKCKSLSELIQQAATDMKELVPKLREYMQAADEVGAKAHADGLKTPLEVFDKYHAGERGTADKKKKEEKKEENKEDNKEKKEKKEKEAKEKKEKKEQEAKEKKEKKEKEAQEKKEKKEKEAKEKKDKKEKKDDKKDEKKEEPKKEEPKAEEKAEEKKEEKPVAAEQIEEIAA